MIGLQTLYTESPGFRMTAQEIAIWCISATMLKRHFPKTTLMTDKRGAMIVEALRIPYSEMASKAFDCIPPGFSRYYALAKIISYRSVHEPFHHCDLDAIWMKPPPEKFLNNRIHVQCPEFEEKHYNMGVLNALADPSWERPGNPWNCGVFGGLDWAMIWEYSDGAINNFFRVAEAASKLSAHATCCVIEQFYLGQFLKEKGIAPVPLLPTLYGSDFMAKSFGFHHFIAGSKRNSKYLPRILEILRQVCPHVTCDMLIDASMIMTQPITEQTL